ncbi:MAG: adenine phosphoribosyltransferase [Mariprofundaceae bacterium]|nr:adenine phosphoribosyltransferase [Mariprofundaceae bacterium]
MTLAKTINFRDFIRDIPDYPKPGIVFKDITPLLADGEAFGACISALACHVPNDAAVIVGIESRGFLFGAALAQLTGLGFVPVRKPGKLPADVHAIEYELEYGMDRLEIHRDAVSHGQKVILVDDLLATGGTASATLKLLNQLGADVVACLFVVELSFLGGRKALGETPVHYLLSYSD